MRVVGIQRLADGIAEGQETVQQHVRQGQAVAAQELFPGQLLVEPLQAVLCDTLQSIGRFGLGFNAVSQKALAASKGARLPRSFWG